MNLFLVFNYGAVHVMVQISAVGCDPQKLSDVMSARSASLLVSKHTSLLCPDV